MLLDIDYIEFLVSYVKLLPNINLEQVRNLLLV